MLHVVENLDRGAVENWLVRMLRHAVASGIQVDWTFYCTLGREGGLDSEVRSLGGKIIQSSFPLSHKIEFAKALRSELRNGNYDVLHAHHDLVSGLYLAAAVGLPIRKRLVHVHNADEGVPVGSLRKQAILRTLLRKTCLTLADGIIGISEHTLETFLHGHIRRSGDRVHYYGIDPVPFAEVKGNRTGFRRHLCLPEDSLLMLFAGRMVSEKNPLFAVDVFAEMRLRNPKVAGVFVGAGSLEGAIRDRAADHGVEECFRALGWRDDVPEIMSCCDWFILPRPESPLEGLGIAVIEAQLAGLRMLLSQGIPDDPILPCATFERLPLSAGASRWAEAALELLNVELSDPQTVTEMLSDSPFDLDFALRDLLSLYGQK